jgi:amino acid adenylation domain-containing protein
MTDRTLYEWFTDTVNRFPERPALRVQGIDCSYRELERSAEALAERMIAQCGGVPRRIALLVMRSHTAYAGYLAALRLGAVVTPLNPRFPSQRNLATCALADVDLVVTDETGTQQVRGDPGWDDGFTVLALADGETLDAEVTTGLPEFSTALDDVAYLLFTSGSTGRPKGVPIRHRNVSPYVAHCVERYQIRPGDRVSHTFDLTFDPSVFDLFVTWAGGAMLVVPQRTDLLAPVDYLVENQITHWFSVPSLISVSQTLGKLHGRADTVRYSLFIGEQFTMAQARAWREIAPGAVIGNVYGPTELTVACSGYELPLDVEQWPATSNDSVPIGPVYEFLDWLVLDEQGGPASEGELVVRGAQRFAGYLDPGDNVGRFVTADGQVYDGTSALTEGDYYRTGDRVRLEGAHWVHLGRLDSQVKIRGYRVELGDIEATMRVHPDISQAIVLLDDEALIGCYTGTPVEQAALIRWMRKKLPIHMVPQRLEHLDALPLNANGKVDRGRLVELVLMAGPGEPAEHEPRKTAR